ncbi:hypothetical protein FBU30_010396 [Linnemannia zychae]|nr:hypothetical protein FBU30_010396 [Linnemannia zychae]
MRILAWYYTIADILLIAQVYYYRRTSVRSSFESVIANNTERHPSASSLSPVEDNDNERKSLLGAPSQSASANNNYLAVSHIPVSGTSADLLSSTALYSSSPASGSISFCQEQDRLLQQQLAQDRIRYQAAQAANITAATSLKTYLDEEELVAPSTTTLPHQQRRASIACSIRTTASERFRFLQKRRSIRQWLLIILPVVATVFFLWSYIEWRECVLGEVGTGDDDFGYADEWWGWTECGRGHGQGKLPPTPDTPSPTPDVNLVFWKSNSDQAADPPTSPQPDTPHAHRRHRHHKTKPPVSNDDQESDSGSWMALLFGWGSAGLYLGSRIPQLYKNWRLKSCEGLSIMMFLFSVFGNALFVASIFLNSMDRAYLIKNMPWWLGSTGTLLFDFAIFAQFYLYRHNSPMDDALREAVAAGELDPEATQALLTSSEDEDQDLKLKTSSAYNV